MRGSFDADAACDQRQSARRYRIIQLTDCHLPDERGALVQGLDTDGTLSRVLDDVLTACDPADLLLLTGDLVDRPSAAAYRLLHKHLDRLDMRCLCLPGNHDDPALMRSALAGRHGSGELHELPGGWRMLTLDSTLPGRSEGWLHADQLARVATAVSDAPAAHLLVALHHHPVPCGSPWMDTLMLKNGETLIDVLDRTGTGTRVVLFGHIHQAFSARRGRVRLLGAPATSCQFEPASVRFQRASLPPGYRWLELGADGVMTTGLHYCGEPLTTVG